MTRIWAYGRFVCLLKSELHRPISSACLSKWTIGRLFAFMGHAGYRRHFIKSVYSERILIRLFFHGHRIQEILAQVHRPCFTALNKTPNLSNGNTKALSLLREMVEVRELAGTSSAVPFAAKRRWKTDVSIAISMLIGPISGTIPRRLAGFFSCALGRIIDLPHAPTCITSNSEAIYQGNSAALMYFVAASEKNGLKNYVKTQSSSPTGTTFADSPSP